MPALITAGLVVSIVSTLIGTATYAYVSRVRAEIEGVVHRFLVIANGVFAMAEIAIVSSRKARLKSRRDWAVPAIRWLMVTSTISSA